jgi:hypothetical protein
VVLCGISRGPNGPWAAVALAAHPSSFARHAVVAPAAAEPSTRLMRSADGLTVRLGEDASVELRLRSALLWPGRVFGARPRPCLARSRAVLASRGAGGQAEGEASLGGVRLRLDGATAYVEKKWAPGLAGHWWWTTPTPPPNGPRHFDRSRRRPDIRWRGTRTSSAHAGTPLFGWPIRDVPPTPRRGRGIRLGGDLGGAHRRKRRRRGACQGRRPAPRRRGGRRRLRHDPGSAQGDRRRLTYATGRQPPAGVRGGGTAGRVSGRS